MPNQKNINQVQELQVKFKESTGIYFTRYKGLNVDKITDLRSRLRNSDLIYKVSKNTLIKIAAKNEGYEGLDDILVGQVGIVYSKDDPAAPAKVIKDFIKDNKAFEISGVLFDGEMVNLDKFDILANLPSRDDLYAKILSGLSQPMTSIVLLLNSSMTKLVNVLDNLKKVKAENS